jgi:hypothetical protein
MLLEEGSENVFARHKRLAGAVRAAVEAWGLRVCAQAPEWYSDTVTAVVVPEGFDANEVIKAAYYRYDLSLGTGLNKVNGKVFRIGHLGWLNHIMVMQLSAVSSSRCVTSGFHSSPAPVPVLQCATSAIPAKQCESRLNEYGRQEPHADGLFLPDDQSSNVRSGSK